MIFFGKRFAAIEGKLDWLLHHARHTRIDLTELIKQGNRLMLNMDKMNASIGGLHDAVSSGAAKIAELAAVIAAANTAGDQAAVDAAADQVAAEAKALADAVAASPSQ